MKLFKYSLLVLAMAFTFTACDDDDKYVEGEKSPGAYFPNDNPSVVELPQSGSSVDITIARTSLDDPSTYTLVSEDPSGIFQIPTTVTFGAQEHSTTITVTYDENEIITGDSYPVTITVEGGSVYGEDTYSFDFCRKSPYITTSTTAQFTSEMWGGPYEVSVEWSVSEIDSNDVLVSILDMFEEVATISIDLGTTFDDGTHPAKLIGTVYTGVTSGGYGIYWSSIMDFYLLNDYTEEEIMESLPEALYDCNFNEDTGLITIYSTYTLPEKGTGYWYGDMHEYIQLAGYPDYSVELEYTGLFVDPSDTMEANISMTTGADVESVQLVNVSGKDYETAYYSIVEGTATDVVEVSGSTSAQIVTFPITEAGTYTCVAVTYGGGQSQLYGYVTYKINVGGEDPNKGWHDLGTGAFYDVWSGLMVSDDECPSWYVQIQESDTTSGLYRLVNPYGEDSAIADYNEGDGEAYIEIDATVTDCIILEPQATGYTMSSSLGSYGDLTICNLEGYYYAAGYTKDEIIDAGVASTAIEDDVIILNNPRFIYSGMGDSLYKWKEQQSAQIALPSALSVPAKKAIGTKATIYTMQQQQEKALKFKRLPTQAPML